MEAVRAENAAEASWKASLNTLYQQGWTRDELLVVLPDLPGGKGIELPPVPACATGQQPAPASKAAGKRPVNTQKVPERVRRQEEDNAGARTSPPQKSNAPSVQSSPAVGEKEKPVAGGGDKHMSEGPADAALTTGLRNSPAPGENSEAQKKKVCMNFFKLVGGCSNKDCERSHESLGNGFRNKGFARLIEASQLTPNGQRGMEEVMAFLGPKAPYVWSVEENRWLWQPNRYYD